MVEMLMFIVGLLLAVGGLTIFYQARTINTLTNEKHRLIAKINRMGRLK